MASPCISMLSQASASQPSELSVAFSEDGGEKSIEMWLLSARIRAQRDAALSRMSVRSSLNFPLIFSRTRGDRMAAMELTEVLMQVSPASGDAAAAMASRPL